jgi:hypothetical protein
MPDLRIEFASAGGVPEQRSAIDTSEKTQKTACFVPKMQRSLFLERQGIHWFARDEARYDCCSKQPVCQSRSCDDFGAPAVVG